MSSVGINTTASLAVEAHLKKAIGYQQQQHVGGVDSQSSSVSTDGNHDFLQVGEQLYHLRACRGAPRSGRFTSFDVTKLERVDRASEARRGFLGRLKAIFVGFFSAGEIDHSVRLKNELRMFGTLPVYGLTKMDLAAHQLKKELEVTRFTNVSKRQIVQFTKAPRTTQRLDKLEEAKLVTLIKTRLGNLSEQQLASLVNEIESDSVPDLTGLDRVQLIRRVKQGLSDPNKEQLVNLIQNQLATYLTKEQLIELNKEILAPEMKFVLGDRIGATNLDVVQLVDEDFNAVKQVLRDIDNVPQSQCDQLDAAEWRVRECCPITGEVLTRETAVEVKLEGRKPILMSRQGVLHVMCRTDHTGKINRTSLKRAQFNQVTSVRSNVVARFFRAFIQGGEINSTSFGYSQMNWKSDAHLWEEPLIID